LRLFWPGAVLLMLWALHALTSPLGRREPVDTAVMGEGEEVERLDTFLNHLNEERRPPPERLSVHELKERIVAVHLRDAWRDVAEPSRHSCMHWSGVSRTPCPGSRASARRPRDVHAFSRAGGHSVDGGAVRRVHRVRGDGTLVASAPARCSG